MYFRDTRTSDIGALCQNGARISYSQFGEDILISHFLRHRNGIYIDVGCHDPYRFSNTALLHNFRGWSGVNIDADPDAIARFNIARPNDININVGVGDTVGSLEFTMFKDAAQNSFDKNMVTSASEKIEVTRRINVAVRPLRDILRDNIPPEKEIDYLDIDCEGFDEKVILGNDWSTYKPRIVTIEIHGLNLRRPHENKIVQIMSEYGYNFISQSFVTSFFRRRG